MPLDMQCVLDCQWTSDMVDIQLCMKQVSTLLLTSGNQSVIPSTTVASIQSWHSLLVHMRMDLHICVYPGQYVRVYHSPNRSLHCVSRDVCVDRNIAIHRITIWVGCLPEASSMRYITWYMPKLSKFYWLRLNWLPWHQKNYEYNGYQYQNYSATAKCIY